MYDPNLKRFITPDPFVSDPFNPRGLNRFAYVHNSPLNFVDPSGFQERESGGPEMSGGGQSGHGTEGGAYQEAMQQAGGNSERTAFLGIVYGIEASQTASAQAAYAAQMAGQARIAAGVSSEIAMPMGSQSSFAGYGVPPESGGAQMSGTTTPSNGPSSETGPTGARPGSGSGNSQGGAGSTPQSRGASQGVSGHGAPSPYVVSMTPGERFALTLPLALATGSYLSASGAIVRTIGGGISGGISGAISGTANGKSGSKAAMGAAVGAVVSGLNPFGFLGGSTMGFAWAGGLNSMTTNGINQLLSASPPNYAALGTSFVGGFVFGGIAGPTNPATFEIPIQGMIFQSFGKGLSSGLIGGASATIVSF